MNPAFRPGVRLLLRQHRGPLATIAIAIVAGLLTLVLDAGLATRAGVIAALCLILWLTEWVPIWVPTVLLWVATPLLIGVTDDRFSLRAVLGWSFDPVLALFLGGFALAAAARRHGMDRALAVH